MRGNDDDNDDDDDDIIFHLISCYMLFFSLIMFEHSNRNFGNFGYAFITAVFFTGQYMLANAVGKLTFRRTACFMTTTTTITTAITHHHHLLFSRIDWIIKQCLAFWCTLPIDGVVWGSRIGNLIVFTNTSWLLAIMFAQFGLMVLCASGHGRFIAFV